ncbi:cysteine hydrolase family protein [Brevibacillus brevis]|uniref:Cysteine hydrolase family protein n=1 Tax=Brevibacillus brevis TaxID=1393 RepID=A0ABY9T7L7_BREBE|nr:cysteine hydrolase family protein [Brevibacillus brevis]WNC16100.1 cysteine hydrolase family protein [Brevibacillus brevis]
MSKKSALLIIDVQEYLIEHAYQGQALAERIGKLAARARALQIPVLYVQHCESEGEFSIGTPTWQIHHSVTPEQHEPVIHKWACDSFLDTPLLDELASRDINHLVITGLQTEYCIDTTCRRAISLGFDVTLVQDAHSTLDSRVLSAEQIIAHHNAVLTGFGTEKNSITAAGSDSVFQ